MPSIFMVGKNMSKSKILFFIIFIFLFSKFCFSENKIAVTEVMANPNGGVYNEFIELYNFGTTDIDLTSWTFTDGDALDHIIAWDSSASYGVLIDTNVIYNKIILPPQTYAVILDTAYISHTQPYAFGIGTIILTTSGTNKSLGNTAGISYDDPITFYNPIGELVSAYGTPVITSSSAWSQADDDGLDSIPINAPTGKSVEKINITGLDEESNWKVCIDSFGSTPGRENSVSIIITTVTITTTTAVYNFQGLITEVMPDNSDDDWIEIFVKDAQESIKGYKIYEGKTLVKTLPDIIPSKNDYIVLHFGQNVSDENNKGSNGYWDFYTEDSGLIATDNCITLRDPSNKIIDFLAYANNDGTWSSSNNDLLLEAVACGEWKTDSIDQTGCFYWQTSYTKSISRIYEKDFCPKDTNTKNDWIISDPTLGYGSNIDGNIESCSTFSFNVLNTPFCPLGGTKYSSAKIIFTNPNNHIIRIRIYDVQGRMVRTLYESDMQGYKEIYWDGKDDAGEILPVGIYIVLAETVDKNNGSRKRNRKLAVLGKKL
jgi:hypothetical protein